MVVESSHASLNHMMKWRLREIYLPEIPQQRRDAEDPKLLSSPLLLASLLTFGELASNPWGVWWLAENHLARVVQ